MEELLVQYGAELLAWIENAAEFTKGQLPLFVEEIIKCGVRENVFLCLAYIGATVGTLLFGNKLLWLGKRMKKQDSYSDSEIPTALGHVLSFAGLFWLAGAVFHVLALIRITTAPRLYIIEQIRSLL